MTTVETIVHFSRFSAFWQSRDQHLGRIWNGIVVLVMRFHCRIFDGISVAIQLCSVSAVLSVIHSIELVVIDDEVILGSGLGRHCYLMCYADSV